MVHRTEEWIYDQLPVLSNCFLLTSVWSYYKISDYEAAFTHILIAISSFFYHQCIAAIDDKFCHHVLRFDCFFANWGLGMLLLRIINIPHDKKTYRKYSYLFLTPIIVFLTQYFHPDEYLSKMPFFFYSGMFSFCIIYSFVYWKTLPNHDWKGVGFGMLITLSGIIFLYLADFIYDKYYIFHTMWHIFVGFGYCIIENLGRPLNFCSFFKKK